MGKGNAATINNNAGISCCVRRRLLNFIVGNGTTHVVDPISGPDAGLARGISSSAGMTQALDIQYFQVNNGTVVQAANTAGSYDSACPSRSGGAGLGGASPPSTGAWTIPCSGKRVLTAQERTDSGTAARLDHFAGHGPVAHAHDGHGSPRPGGTTTTQERLEVDGAIKVGTALGTTDGTLRWSGTDIEARKGGAWVSMTAGAGGQPLDATLTALAGWRPARTSSPTRRARIPSPRPR